MSTRTGDDGSRLIDATTAPVPQARVVLGLAVEEVSPTRAIVRPWARLEPVENCPGSGAHVIYGCEVECHCGKTLPVVDGRVPVHAAPQVRP